MVSESTVHLLLLYGDFLQMLSNEASCVLSCLSSQFKILYSTSAAVGKVIMFNFYSHSAHVILVSRDTAVWPCPVALSCAVGLINVDQLD